jgi:hypothetical protein
MRVPPLPLLYEAGGHSLRFDQEEFGVGLLLDRGFFGVGGVVRAAVDAQALQLFVFCGSFYLVFCLRHFRIRRTVNLLKNIHFVVVRFTGDADGVDHLLQEVVAEFVLGGVGGHGGVRVAARRDTTKPRDIHSLRLVLDVRCSGRTVRRTVHFHILGCCFIGMPLILRGEGLFGVGSECMIVLHLGGGYSAARDLVRGD